MVYDTWTYSKDTCRCLDFNLMKPCKMDMKATAGGFYIEIMGLIGAVKVMVTIWLFISWRLWMSQYLRKSMCQHLNSMFLTA